MRILLVNRHFGGEHIPTGRMLRDLSRELLQRGHDVRVLTARSTYVQTTKGTESGTGAKITCLWTPGEKQRGLSWLLFWFQACLIAPFLQWDRCVVLTDPPFMVPIAWISRLLGRKRQVYWWTMDLYPEYLVGHGLVKPGSILHRLLCWLNNLGARALSGTICLGHCQKDRLRAYPTWDDSDESYLMVPPWDLRSIPRVDPGENRFTEKYDLDRKRLVLYAGNIGVAHSYQEILNVARLFHEQDQEDIQFVFVVRGVRREGLQRDSAELSNVSVLDYQPIDMTADLLWSPDVHVITLREGWEGVAVPSKLYGILKTEAPVLFIGPANADTAEEIRRYGAGLAFTPDCEPETLKEAVEELLKEDWRKKRRPDRDGPARIADFITR
jgi:hypothetical protein